MTADCLPSDILSVSIGLVRLIVFTVWVLPITQLTSCTTGGRTSRISFPGSTWERETEALPQGARCESKEPRDILLNPPPRAMPMPPDMI
jgi:hypothetical protein